MLLLKLLDECLSEPIDDSSIFLGLLLVDKLARTCLAAPLRRI